MEGNEQLNNLQPYENDDEKLDKVITITDIIGTTVENENIIPSSENDEQTPPPAAGMKEIRLEDIDSKTKFIENPLPVPKRREHREMDYMIKVSDTDDFDITDMTGMDYYDVM